MRYRLAEKADSLCEAMLTDLGKPIRTGLAYDILPTLDSIKTLIKKGEAELKTKSVSTPLRQFYMGLTKGKVYRQPYGVVAVIGTWDYPVFANIELMVAALLAGNTVVWKPSEFMPNTTNELKHVFDALPKDIISILEGSAEAANHLTKAKVDKILFRGSTVTGRKAMAQAANYTTPIGLELGGKDAMVIHKEADVERAITALRWALVHNSGQSPFKPQRLFIHSSLYADFKEKLIKELEKIKLGPADQPTTEYAPQFNDPLARLAEKIIQDAVGMGARLLTGGNCVREHQGTHIQPAVLEGVTEKMRLDNTDIWAPIVTLRKFDSDVQVIRWVNDHPLGMGVTLWGKDIKELDNLAKRLDIGNIQINGMMTQALGGFSPMSGRRLSGSMVRHDCQSIRHMTRPQVITHDVKFMKPVWQQKVMRKKWLLDMLISFKAGQYKRMLSFWQSKRK